MAFRIIATYQVADCEVAASHAQQLSLGQQFIRVYPHRQAMFPAPESPTLRFLAVQPWYTCLPLAAQTRVRDSLLHRTAKKGEVVLEADVPVEGWYAVLTGLVKLQSVSVKGRFSTFLCIAAGDWFGEGSALNTERRRYDVVALRDSELLCLPVAEFHHLLATSLEFNQCLVRLLSIRVGQAMSVIESGRLRTPEQRVALSLSRQFWGRTRRLNLSQEEIANLVGISRQSVNQALKSLSERQLVTLEFGRVDIPDDNALTRFIFSDADEPPADAPPSPLDA